MYSQNQNHKIKVIFFAGKIVRSFCTALLGKKKAVFLGIIHLKIHISVSFEHLGPDLKIAFSMSFKSGQNFSIRICSRNMA